MSQHFTFDVQTLRTSLLALALALALVAHPAGAQVRRPWDACVFGDTQRVVNINEDFIFDAQVKAQAWIDDVNDCITNTDASFHVGDWVDSQQSGTTNLCSDIEWRRIRNIFLGPRSTFEGVVSCDAECIALDNPFDCCVSAGAGTCDGDDLTALNTGTTAFLATSLPFVGARGNHETENTTGTGTWSYRTFSDAVWYSGTPKTLLGDATPRRYQRPDTYLGTFNDGDSDNHAFLIELGGRNTLVLTIGCGITQAEADWAVAVLRARQHLPAIIVYHVDALSGTPNFDRISDSSLAGGRQANGQGGVSCQTGSESEGAVVVDDMWDLIVARATNVRITLSGHYFDGFVNTSCTLAGVPEACCTGLGTGNCQSITEGAVSMAANGTTTVLEVVTDFQGLNNQSTGSGCVMTMTYSASTIQTEVASPGSGTGCDGETVDARFDQEFPTAQALPFDPTPCNMLVTERTGRTRTTFGCG